MPAFQFRDEKVTWFRIVGSVVGAVVAPNLPRIAKADQVYTAMLVLKRVHGLPQFYVANQGIVAAVSVGIKSANVIESSQERQVIERNLTSALRTS